MSYNNSYRLQKIPLLGVGFTMASKKNILEYILQYCKNTNNKWYVVTPNPEILVIASKNQRYKNVLNGADLASVDGVGILLAAKALGKNFHTRFSGVDMVEEVCRLSAEKPIKIGFLGGSSGVAEKTVECLKTKFPSLHVAFVSEEFESSKTYPHADILFVAFGSPKQELFIADNLKDLPATVAIGVGGAFDFISGKVQRAPMLIQSLGLEWLFRLITQPWRIKRQLRLLTFIYLVLRSKLLKENVAY